MAEPGLDELLKVAMDVAYAAGRTTLGYFDNGAAVEWKADGTPVTVADREAESVMRGLIGRAFPGHAILGEEQGEQAGDADFRWILDPIDGTYTFIHGVPLYGTLVGVEVRGEPAVGVIYMPALDEMVAAARGLGCRVNGRPARVSPRTELGESLVVCTSEKAARARSGGWERLADASHGQRTWADCYAYVLVATGRAEVAVDPVMNPWDCAALLPVVEEAGGRFTAWDGARTIHGGDAVASNGVLHDQVLGLLSGA